MSNFITAHHGVFS